MKAIKHPSSNKVFTAPSGTEGWCDPLHVTAVDDPDIGPVLMSAWQPEPEEIEAIKAGKPVLLFVYGRGHPPVALGVEK